MRGKKRTYRTRRVRIGVGCINTKATWERPTLTFVDSKNNERVEVIISINGPWDIQYIRRELNVIAQYWKEKSAEL